MTRFYRSFSLSLSLSLSLFLSPFLKMHGSINALVVLARRLGAWARGKRGRYSSFKTFWKAHSMGNYLLLNAIDKLCWVGDNSSSSSSSSSSSLSASQSSTSASSNSLVRGIFSRVILDAPDVPTWFFADTVTRCVGPTHGVAFLHLFNGHDSAVEAGRIRRAITGVYPGNGLVLPATWPLPPPTNNNNNHNDNGGGGGGFASSVGHIEAVACDGARMTLVHHDYGQVDGLALLTQRDFLCGVPPNLRLLDLIEDENGTTGVEGAKCWRLRLGY